MSKEQKQENNIQIKIDGSNGLAMGKLHHVGSFFMKFGTLIGIGIICVVFAILSPVFLRYDNLFAIVAHTSAVGVAAIGLTLVVMTGNLDLSFGSVVGLSGMTAAFLLTNGHSIFVAVIAGLLVGLAVGIVNGLLVVGLGINSLVATISTQVIVFGIAYFYSGGVDIHKNIEEPFTLLGHGSTGPIPNPALLLIIILAITFFVTQFTCLGRLLYAIGDNKVAPLFSGIRVSFLKMVVYAIAGVLAATAGIIMLARLEYGAAYTGQGYLLEGFAAVYMGSTILKSGRPNVIGSVIGAMFMMILNNGFQLLGVNFVLQIALKGFALLIIVLIHSRLSMVSE